MNESDSSNGKKKGAVGYGRPPVNGQFKPGQSGNPNGRPRRQKDRKTMITDILTEKISLRDKNGRIRKLTTDEVMFKVMTNKAIAGNVKAFQIVLEEADRYRVFEHQTEASPSDVLQSAWEKLEKGLKEYMQEDSEEKTQNGDTDASSPPKKNSALRRLTAH